MAHRGGARLQEAVASGGPDLVNGSIAIHMHAHRDVDMYFHSSRIQFVNIPIGRGRGCTGRIVLVDRDALSFTRHNLLA